MFDSSRLGNAMRGEDRRSEGFFSYVRPGARIPADYPLRAIRELVDAALRELSSCTESHSNRLAQQLFQWRASLQ
jgi:hypothetical protein